MLIINLSGKNWSSKRPWKCCRNWNHK